MKKIILTIIGLALAPPAWSAQTAVTQISGTQASIGALKTQTNLKLETVESNRQDHETRVTAMETGKASKPYINSSAPADLTLDWYDTDQEPGVYVHKKHNGTAWVRVGSYGVQYLSNCAVINAGICIDTDDGKLYYHNNTSVVEVGTSGENYTLPTASSDTLGGIKVGSRLSIADGVLSADVQTTDISGKENSLGNPSTNGYVLSSTTSGVRSWVEMTGGGTGIAHATADGNYYASKDGGWADLSGVFAPPLGADDNYVTDAEKTKLGNLSGINTGDQDLSGYSLTSSVLTKTNTTAFSPTGDYHPATKKYVDDAVTAGGGYTDEQAQDAVGGMFSGNTETGITVTYNDSTGKVDFVVAAQSDVNFTSALNTKLAGIAAGAEVNVNADWNASSGDAQILNKPTIPTISDTAYGISWNGDLGAASKNAIYDKIETIAGGSMTWPSTVGIAVYGGSNAWGTSIAPGTGVATALAAPVDGTGGLASKASLDALPNIAFGTGIAVAEDTPSAGTDTVSIDADTTPTDGSAKPITSNAVFDALAGKQATLVSGTNIKTVNNTSLLGSGNITITGGTGGGLTSTLSSAPYSDVACTADGVYNHTLYKCIDNGSGTGYFTEYVATTAYLNTTPVDTTPDAFTFADVTNATLSTEYTALAQINGIAAGITCSGSGGTVAACTGSTAGTCGTFGSTSGSITNGQYVGAKVTSSSTASTASNNIVTCGGVSDTFTVTTATDGEYSDNFNRADQDPLISGYDTNSTPTGSWVTAPGADSESKILSNIVAASSGFGTESVKYSTRTTWNSDQWASCTIPAAIGADSGPAVRINTSGARNSYMLSVNGTTSVRVVKIFNGVPSVVSGSAQTVPTIGTGDVIKLSVVGNSLYAYINNILINGYPVTDTSISTGSPGFVIRNSGAFIDNWSGGNN